MTSSTHAETPGHHAGTPGTPGLFKYMRTDDLSGNERQRLIGRLEGESQSIRFEFATLVHNTETELHQRNISPARLVHKFYYYDASLKSEFSEDDSIEQVFYIANDYWSFFNYDLLEYVIKIFKLGDIDAMLKQYVVNFRAYCKRRLCECPGTVAGSYNESGRRIVLKLDDKMSVQRSTLQDLRRLQDQASKVTGVNVMQLLTIEEGCLHLIYRIPHSAIEKVNLLTAEKKRKLRDIGVLSITCEKKMVRWQIESDALKRLVSAGEQCILTKSIVITELTTYKTDVTLTLGTDDAHIMVRADVTTTQEQDDKSPHDSDQIMLKVIPALHQNKQARTLPSKEAANSLHSFEIPHVMPLHEVCNSKTDMFEFFIELHIQSKTGQVHGRAEPGKRLELKSPVKQLLTELRLPPRQHANGDILQATHTSRPERSTSCSESRRTTYPTRRAPQAHRNSAFL